MYSHPLQNSKCQDDIGYRRDNPFSLRAERDKEKDDVASQYPPKVQHDGHTRLWQLQF
jgi:hypothetical protein